MSGSERQRELRRRRKRKKQYDLMKRRLDKAAPSEKQHMADKLRRMTPGAERLIEDWKLEEKA